jgi:hypothetical protein
MVVTLHSWEAVSIRILLPGFASRIRVSAAHVACRVIAGVSVGAAVFHSWLITAW